MKPYLYSQFLNGPHQALFTLLIFILGIHLGATPLQLTVMACLKPITSFFSFYLSMWIVGRPQKIRVYLILNALLGTIPCFFYPLIDNIWYYIGTYALYMVTMRAIHPAWMEILKQESDMKELGRLSSWGNFIYYGINMVVPVLFSFLMDQYGINWKYLFIVTSLWQLLNLFVIASVQIKEDVNPCNVQFEFLKPLKKGWKVLKEKPHLVHYLLLFFLGGAGIIGIYPILPIFFKEELHLNTTKIALAFSCCRGITFLTTSRLWASILERTSIYFLNTIVNGLTCLFFGCIIASFGGIHWLLIAYLFYGAMQAGCELSWNVSGPLFSGEEESTLYSSLNLALVGIRGCLCPIFGYALYQCSSITTVFAIGLALSIIGVMYGLWLNERYKTPVREVAI